jgi:hypothetical protein
MVYNNNSLIGKDGVVLWQQNYKKERFYMKKIIVLITIMTCNIFLSSEKNNGPTQEYQFPSEEKLRKHLNAQGFINAGISKEIAHKTLTRDKVRAAAEKDAAGYSRFPKNNNFTVYIADSLTRNVLDIATKIELAKL